MRVDKCLLSGTRMDDKGYLFYLIFNNYLFLISPVKKIK